MLIIDSFVLSVKKTTVMEKRLSLKGVTFCGIVVTLVLASLLFSSCLKDGEDTIVLPLPDGKIPTSVIPQNLQDSLTRNGFIINEGINPPDIEGVYLASPLDLHYSSDGYNNAFYDLTMTFRDQKARGLITYSERQRDTVEGASIAAQVIGEDSNFTMYCYQYVFDYAGSTQLWRCKIATVVSGVKTNRGFRDCQYSYIMLEKVAISDYYYSMLAKEETFRIYKDGDRLATRIR